MRPCVGANQTFCWLEGTIRLGSVFISRGGRELSVWKWVVEVVAGRLSFSGHLIWPRRDAKRFGNPQARDDGSLRHLALSLA
jgi:hypothetical protein